MARARLNEHGVTEQQEKFCHAFVETGNASESYRRSYNAGKMADATISKRASDLLDNGAITGRIAILRQKHTKRHNITVDTLLEKLNTVYTTALAAETPQSSAAVQAIMAQAKLLGLDKQLIELSGDVTVRTKAEMFKDLYGDET